jgi:hypothetical protein
MMHPMFSEDYLRATEDAYAAFEITPSIGQKRLFVIAFQGAAPVGVCDPGSGRAMTHAPRPFNSAEPVISYPDWQTSAFPQGGGRPDTRDAGSYWARPVLGRVVGDAAGRLCEVVGQEIRPLSRVVRGPRGEFFELLPVTPQVHAQKAGEDVIDGELVDNARPSNRQENVPFQPSADGRQKAAAPRFRCRKLFAEPGLPRVVELGGFRTALAPQLAHAERLRDLHRLACHVQIYEALARQRADEFLEAIQCADHQNIPVQPLTEETIATLGLTEFLVRHPRPSQDARREPGYVLPYECFYSVRISSDPTAELATQAPVGTSTSCDAARNVAPAAPAPATSTQAAGPSPRRAIPERFQNPWEFRFGRDEVLYDMNVRSASTGSVRTLLRKVGRWFRRREEFRRWRALLCAKNLEEQLWSVRPPTGALADPAVQAWARQTLEAAGYDARAMLLEWEIFWRRKGA